MKTRLIDMTNPVFFPDEIYSAVEDFETLNPFGVGYEALGMIPMKERSLAMVELRRTLINDFHSEISAAAKFLFVVGRGQKKFGALSPTAFELTKLYTALNKDIKYGKKRMLPGCLILAAVLINFDVRASAYWVPDALINVDQIKCKQLKLYAFKKDLFDEPMTRRDVDSRANERRYKVAEARERLVVESFKNFMNDSVSDRFKEIVKDAEAKAIPDYGNAVKNLTVPEEFEDCD
jgi:hypothetical protein